jgi:hypothetical protein
MFHQMQATTFPPHSCRYNKLGAAGAKELVKGNWPELRVLDIGWGGPVMLLCIHQHNSRMDRS